MYYVLSARSQEMLRRFAVPTTAFAFDFDGTLAPIVSNPEHARLKRSTRLYLRKLAGIRTCLAVSGRSRADLQHKLAGTGIRCFIGNHGAETGGLAGPPAEAVVHWERSLARELPEIPGLWIENKGWSLTVHYRQCPGKPEARVAIAKAARALSQVRIVEGKDAVSIVPETAPHKGSALAAALIPLKCDRALFVGDEETDEDVFGLGRGGPAVFGIRVGSNGTSRAGYFLRKQTEIDELLRVLVHLPPGRRAGCRS